MRRTASQAPNLQRGETKLIAATNKSPLLGGMETGYGADRDLGCSQPSCVPLHRVNAGK